MNKPLSVKQFNEYIKSNIKHDPIFQRLNLTGELCNIRINNYHLYFSLKEGSDIIDAVIYYYEDKETRSKYLLVICQKHLKTLETHTLKTQYT